MYFYVLVISTILNFRQEYLTYLLCKHVLLCIGNSNSSQIHARIQKYLQLKIEYLQLLKSHIGQKSFLLFWQHVNLVKLDDTIMPKCVQWYSNT